MIQRGFQERQRQKFSGSEDRVRRLCCWTLQQKDMGIVFGVLRRSGDNFMTQDLTLKRGKTVGTVCGSARGANRHGTVCDTARGANRHRTVCSTARGSNRHPSQCRARRVAIRTDYVSLKAILQHEAWCGICKPNYEIAYTIRTGDAVNLLVISETAHLKLRGGSTVHGLCFLPQGTTTYEKL
jgi:hypothetical protein